MTAACAAAPAVRTAPALPPRGFSLLEVLVALAIMAMSLGVVYAITGGSARQIVRLQGQDAAWQLADGVLATIQSVPEQGISSREQAQGYAWEVTTRAHAASAVAGLAASPGAADAVRLHEVTVTVHWQDGDGARSLTLSSLRPQRLPTAAAPQ